MNKMKPIKIEIDGKEWLVRFNMAAMIRFEEFTGKNALTGAAYETLTAKDAVAFIWACIASNPDAPTIDELAEILAPDTLGEITNTIFAATNQAMPEKKDYEGNADNLSHG